jgi:hypothetical protein
MTTTNETKTTKASIQKQFNVTIETKLRKEGDQLEIYASVYPGQFKSVAARRAAKVGTLMCAPENKPVLETWEIGPRVGLFENGGVPSLMNTLLRNIKAELETR